MSQGEKHEYNGNKEMRTRRKLSSEMEIRLEYFRDGAVLQDERTQDVRVGWGYND